MPLFNLGGNGTQALAQLLRDEGLRVRTAGSVPEAVAAGPGATVAVVNIGLLTDDQRAALARSGADITVVGALYQNFDGLTAAAVPQGASATGVLAPRCRDDDAVAAEALGGSRGSVSVDEGAGAVGCFPVDGDRFAYATAPLSGGGRLRVVADADLVTNDTLAQADHAAHLDKIRTVIGPGGKTINKIVDETGVKIDIDDDGQRILYQT